MVSTEFKECLLIMYQEINEHHREQTKQNNQVIAFYIALVSFFIGINSSLVKEYTGIVINCIYITIIFVGFLVILMLVQLRVWQLRYAGGIQLIASIFFSDFSVNNNADLERCIRHFCSRSATKHSLFAPLTCKMIWGCVLISLAPIVLYHSYLSDTYFSIAPQIDLGFLCFLVMYLSTVYYCFKRRIDKTGNAGDLLWLFDTLNFQNIRMMQ